jgi:ATP-dependent DNA helicase RecQ
MPAGAAPVFERLRAWRAGVAKEQGLPAYVIFHDATLREIAARVPGTLAALGTVTGVGQTKLERYGEQVLAVLADGDPTSGPTPGPTPAPVAPPPAERRRPEPARPERRRAEPARAQPDAIDPYADVPYSDAPMDEPE